jgi:hypothetical protein
MKTQEEFLHEILGLKKENPEMEIHFCVDSDEVLEYGWTAHKITSVKTCPWFEDDENILTDEDEIKDYFNERADENITEDEVECHIKFRYASEVKEAICIFTHAG